MTHGLFQWSSNAQRKALSTIELMGCLIALTGGLALGAAYMGIDLRTLAVGVLEEAELIEPRIQLPDPDAQSTGSKNDQENQSKTEDTDQLENSKNDANSAGPPSTEQSSGKLQKTSVQSSSSKADGPATRAYWVALTSAMMEEAQGRMIGIGNPEQWQLFDYLKQRKEGHEKTLKTLLQLDPRDVDQRVLEHSEQLLKWHDNGATLYKHSLGLLSDGPTVELKGPFAQSWQTKATQHRMEERVVIEKHAAVAAYLDHTYPKLAPFTPAFQPNEK